MTQKRRPEVKHSMSILVSLIRCIKSAYLFQQVCRQHQNFCVWAEALDSPKVANPLLNIFGVGHNLKHMDGGPGHVMSEHFEIDELQ